MSKVILVGKKAKWLNLLKVNSATDVAKFPEEVQAAIKVYEEGLVVDSLEYAEGEKIPFGSYIAWEHEERCKHGWNLWCKSNAADQLKSGVLEEVDGKFRQTKIVPFKAQLFDGEMPEVFAEVPTFKGQVMAFPEQLTVLTPWGIASCETGKGFAMVYGVFGEDEEYPFSGMLNGNILTVGTQTFFDYYVVNEEGSIIEPLADYYDRLNK